MTRGFAAACPHAVENAMAIGFDGFSGQVLAFLSADCQEYYRSRGVWEALKNDVIRALEERQPSTRPRHCRAS
jgi:hypothetical protein